MRYLRQVVLPLAVATFAFTAALLERDTVNPWLATGAAALMSLLALELSVRMPAPSRWIPESRSIALATGLGLVLVVATHVAYAVAVHVWPGLRTPVAELYETVQAEPGPALAAPVLVVVVCTEELVWRGVLFRALRRATGPILTVIAATVAYTLPHLLAGVWLLAAAAAALGSVLTVQRLITGRLIDPVVTHIVWSLSIFAILPLPH